ncbi:thiamine pyrophosphate-dependent enzyme [Methanolobus sp. ZRKC3]|uniref:thiamine pyrophosphate-dependent enzyme n=1 Tax=Methanolobus sp. ZRKC3 TaxID=3125786 RepID=UPI00324EC0F5
MNDSTNITGLEALFLGAIDSNVRLITAVAGFPITAVADRFTQKEEENEYRICWITNEKSAMETALGASVCGQRSMVLVKHVGMNVLSDPLITAMTHTIGAGLVILAGDDPAARASQNEQDSRWYGKVAETLVYDPSNPKDAYETVMRAFELSEKAKVPVIVRVTDRLEKDEVEMARKSNTSDYPKAAEFDRSIWTFTMHGKHQRFHRISYPILVDETENCPLNKISLNGSDVGIISSGYPSRLVDEFLDKNSGWSDVSHLSLNVVSPFPYELVSEFIKKHKDIIVVEESESYIESHLNILDNIRGKHSGHLPYGIIEPENIEFALENVEKDNIEKYTEIQTIKKRGTRPICNECPYMPLYHMLRELDVMIAGDMGCSIRTAPEPLGAVDTGFALGGAISTACGFKDKGIAVIGDFGLAHSGIIGLINAINCNSEVTIIVLQNDVAAMTGGQETPDIYAAVKALVPDTSVIDIDELTGISGFEEAKEILRNTVLEKMEESDISVIYIKGKCIKF